MKNKFSLLQLNVQLIEHVVSVCCFDLQQSEMKGCLNERQLNHLFVALILRSNNKSQESEKKTSCVCST